MNIVYGCVTLRAIEERDLEILLEMMNSPEVESTSGAFNYPISTHEQRDWMMNFKNSDKCLRLMVELENGHTIGTLHFYNIDWKNRVGELGYKLSPTAKGRIPGDSVDALTGFIQYAFLQMGMNRIEGTTYSDNIFSLKLVRKVGFKEEGVLRQRVYRNGKFCDTVAVALLREDFIKNSQ